jgi:protein-tyrosine phosphatase
VTAVLAVCTGNICRSPAAERLLAAQLADVAGLTVASAGTSALAGDPIDPPMAALLAAAGAPTGSFAARQLQPRMLREADLVLVMTRQHRSAVVAAEPTAVRRTFLLGELAVLGAAVAAAGWPADVPADPAARLAALPRLAAAHRGSVALPDDLEVVDPHRRGPEVYARALQQVTDAVGAVVAAVR